MASLYSYVVPPWALIALEQGAWAREVEKAALNLVYADIRWAHPNDVQSSLSVFAALCYSLPKQSLNGLLNGDGILIFWLFRYRNPGNKICYDSSASGQH